MENKKEYCKNLFKRWKEIKEKIQAHRITTEIEDREQPSPSREEWEELDVIEGKLKGECIDFLSPTETMAKEPEEKHRHEPYFYFGGRKNF